jgi:uncharacterized protein (TIGR03067 family)
MRLLPILVGTFFLMGADDGADAVKKDMQRLEGNWSMVSGESNGTLMPENFLKGSKRVAKDGVTSVTIGGMPFMKAKFTVDPSKTPKTIDYTMLEGLTKGKKQLGIYEFDGDRVKFCFASPGMARPTDFSAKTGSGRTTSVWQRDKK